MTTERPQLTVEQYLAEVLSLVEPLSDHFDEPFTRALGLTLAAPVTSRGPVPAFANSAMDGFAVHAADLAVGAVLREVADVPAGSGADPRVARGECARIMTGAPVPTSCDTVIQRELVTELPSASSGTELNPGDDPSASSRTEPTPGGDPAPTDRSGASAQPVDAPSIVINDLVEPGASVRHPGEDLAAGDEVLPAGHRLDARSLALVAACGRDEVAVVRRPIVNVASTGDELSPPGRDLARGQIYESNAVFLAEAAIRDGAEVLRTATLPDDPARFASGLDELARHADLVVLSGGVSVGDYDVVRIVLAERGGAEFRSVFMQPGKPQGYATWSVGGRRVPVLALPGNPLSAAVSYELFVRPVIEKLLGRLPRPWTPAVADDSWASPAGRRQFVPVVIDVDAAGVRRLRRAHRRGSQSHMVSALVLADALASVGEDVTQVRPGDVLMTRSLT